jgi:hypothetical protein
MAGNWKEQLFCTTTCSRCHKQLTARHMRILSCYDHDAICMTCKRREEKRPDYEEKSKEMIGQCLIDSELSQSDPQGYCYSHFYPYKCLS